MITSVRRAPSDSSPPRREYALAPSNNETVPPESNARRKRDTMSLFCTRLPLLGFLSLCVAVIGSIGVAIVLAASNGVPVEVWESRHTSVQPAVLLAILSALINASLRYAFSDAFTIGWWVKSTKGSSVADLQKYWQYGASTLHAIVAQRGSFSAVGVSALIVGIVFLDGPLIQRATGVKIVARTETLPITVQISPDPFMAGQTAVMKDHSSYPTYYQDTFSQAIKGYNSRSTIRIARTACRDICNTTLVAAGFDVSCNKTGIPWSFPILNSTEQSYGANTSTVFNVTADFVQVGAFFSGQSVMSHQLWLSTISHKDPMDANSTLVQHQCVLKDAVIRYPISISNETLTLLDPPAGNVTQHLTWRWYETAYLGGSASSIGGFWLALQDRFESSGHYLFKAGSWWPEPDGTSSREYLNKTSLTWSDPMEDMLSMTRELAFRTNLLSSADMIGEDFQNPNTTNYIYYNVEGYNASIPTLDQQQSAQDTYSETVYQSHYGFMAGALALILICLLGILPLFWGWWMLGHSVTFSPIEIGRAFEAPLLEHNTDNEEDTRNQMKSDRQRWVRYDGTKKSFVGPLDRPLSHGVPISLDTYDHSKTSVTDSVRRI